MSTYSHGWRCSVGRPTQNFDWVGHNAFGPTNNWPVMFVNSSSVKLVKKQIFVKLVKLVLTDVRF